MNVDLVNELYKKTILNALDSKKDSDETDAAIKRLGRHQPALRVLI